MRLRRLFKNRIAQSTAEYGIIFAAVIAIAAGALSVSLKNAINVKNDRAMDFMLSAGTDTLDNAISDQESMQNIYSVGEQLRHTTSYKDGFADQKVRLKGGAEQKLNKSKTETTTIDLNRIVTHDSGS